MQKQFFYGGGADEREKMRSCEILKFLLYKSQKDGGPSQFRTPCLYSIILPGICTEEGEEGQITWKVYQFQV